MNERTIEKIITWMQRQNIKIQDLTLEQLQMAIKSKS